MRFIVVYEKEDGHVVGRKMFDVAGKQGVDDIVRACAAGVAGVGATIMSVKANDGSTDLGEERNA